MNAKDSNKAHDLELKGDQCLEKNQDKKAFEFYKKALALDETRLELYDKLQNLHAKYSDQWEEKDFAYNVSLTMKRQEAVDPTFKRLHAQAAPEYKEVSALIKKMLNAKTRAEETQCVEAIAAKGLPALYPLIDHVLGLKTLGERLKAKKADKKQGGP